MALRRIIGAAALLPAALVLLGLAGHWSAAADSLAHFRHYLAAIAAGAALLLLALKLRWAALTSLVAALTGLVMMPQLWPPEEVPGEGGLVLVQANLYLRNHTAPGFAEIADGADLLTLQEVSEQHLPLLRGLGFAELQRCERSGPMGVAVLSRLPAVARGCAEGLAWMRVETGQGEITVASLHLRWPWPYGQWAHLAWIAETLSSLPQPVVIAGDFNAAPWSASVGEVGRLTGTRVVPGLRTTLVQRIPFLGIRLGLPVDHVLLPPELAAGEIAMTAPVGSDHLPLRARLVRRP